MCAAIEGDARTFAGTPVGFEAPHAIAPRGPPTAADQSPRSRRLGRTSPSATAARRPAMPWDALRVPPCRPRWRATGRSDRHGSPFGPGCRGAQPPVSRPSAPIRGSTGPCGPSSRPRNPTRCHRPVRSCRRQPPLRPPRGPRHPTPPPPSGSHRVPARGGTVSRVHPHGKIAVENGRTGPFRSAMNRPATTVTSRSRSRVILRYRRGGGRFSRLACRSRATR